MPPNAHLSFYPERQFASSEGSFWGFGPASFPEEVILTEHLRGRALTQSEIKRFASKGVSELALCEPWPVLSDRVIFNGKGLFDFAREIDDEGAVNCFTIAVTGTSGVVDIAAWQPVTRRIALLLGRGFALGENQLWDPRFNDEPVMVWRSPFGWLRSCHEGLVILRPRAAHFYLGHLPALAVEDVEHGEELEKLLFPPKPSAQIMVLAGGKQSKQRSAA
jgi:hypothetical protein